MKVSIAHERFMLVLLATASHQVNFQLIGTDGVLFQSEGSGLDLIRQAEVVGVAPELIEWMASTVEARSILVYNAMIEDHVINVYLNVSDLSYDLEARFGNNHYEGTFSSIPELVKFLEEKKANPRLYRVGDINLIHSV